MLASIDPKGMSDALTLFLTIITIVGIGWKANEELAKIRRELKDNTQKTIEAKDTTDDIGTTLKKELQHQFVKLQSFNAARYRDVVLNQAELKMQLEQMHERLLKVEARLSECPRIDKSKESSSDRSNECD